MGWLRNEIKLNFSVIYLSCYYGFQVVPKEPFVPLTKEEENEVARAFYTNRYTLMICLYVIEKSLICIIANVGLASTGRRYWLAMRIRTLRSQERSFSALARLHG